MKVNRDGLSARVLDDVEVQDVASFSVINWNTSQLGEDVVAMRTPVVELNSSYGASELRDKVVVAGSGTQVLSLGSILMNTGATTGSSIKIEAAENGRYVPGQGAEMGVGLRVPAQPTGDGFVRWGGLSTDNDDFVGFGYDSGGVFVQVVRDNVSQIKIYQADWNLDKLDGTGRSGVTLDLNNGNIYQIDFTWYGYGEILFSVVDRIVDASGRRRQIPIKVHTFKPTTQTSIASPNLKVFAESSNGTGTQDILVQLGGRQYSVIGPFLPKYRLSSDFRGSVNTSTTVVPLVSAQRKTGFGDRSVKLSAISGLAGNASHILEVRVGGVLTGASFGTPTNHTAAETAMDFDKSATAITGGIVIDQILIPGGSAGERQLTKDVLDLDLPNGDIVSLCARTITGTSTVTASLLQLKEEW